MIMFFPMSLSGAAQRWFASLDVSRRRTWDDLAQEFLDSMHLILSLMYRGENSRLLGRNQTSQFLHSFLAGVGRLPRSLIGL